MYPLEYDEIGERLRGHRRARGISQETLLQELSLRGNPMGRNKLSGMENGDEKWLNSVSLAQLAEICDILGCSVGHLLGEYECLDSKAQVVQDETELSEGAINVLRSLKDDECNRTRLYTQLLSLLLESANLRYSLSLLGSYISCHFREVAATYFDEQSVSLGSVSVRPETALRSFISTNAVSEAQSAADRYRGAFTPRDLLEFYAESILFETAEPDEARRASEDMRKKWNNPDAENPFLEGSR